MKSRRTRFAVCSLLFAIVAGSNHFAWAAPQRSPYPHSAPAAAGSQQSTPPSGDASTSEEVFVPGPLRSFLRMAAISQKVTPEEVLPLLARNVVVSGYQDGKPTRISDSGELVHGPGPGIGSAGRPRTDDPCADCDDAKPLAGNSWLPAAADLAGRMPRWKPPMPIAHF